MKQHFLLKSTDLLRQINCVAAAAIRWLPVAYFSDSTLSRGTALP
ncbi:hypothetical protein ACFPAG_00280 [Vogesella sp. GCM10023246]|uniref:Transposase n=1 Tax=Vogesella oryzagri TaxID=3160864 RepID=A0ABV1LYU7_9NEIS